MTIFGQKDKGQKRMLFYYCKWIFDQSERALPYIEIN